MSRWIIRGLKTGVVTTHYPKKEETSPGISPGLPQDMACNDTCSEALVSQCPADALHRTEGGVTVERTRCIHCYRCIRDVDEPVLWDTGFEWASIREKVAVFSPQFHHSIHIRVLDAGACGACLNEIKLLNNPFYNMHRLGFFITPTPRQADILMVTGPVTDHMKTALIKAYEAMPTPKRVVAVGTCALSGGIFESSFMTDSGVSGTLPVDIEIPGCPPPPLAILHGLLVIAGRKIIPEPAKSGCLIHNKGEIIND